ncbi:MAG: BofC C-terminal domain-containing protein [Bacillota bacterium]
MKIIRNIVMIILLIIIVAVISYQLLNISLLNQEEDKLETKLEIKQDLSDLLVEENNKLKNKQRNIKSDCRLLSKDNFKLQINKVDDVDLFRLDFKSILELMKQSKQEDDVAKTEMELQSAENLFLGIKDGYVAIYRGDILGEAELIEVRKDIPIKSLAEEDIKNLQLGIKVDNKTELFSILEGFLSAEN